MLWCDLIWYDMIYHDTIITSGNNIYSTLNIRTNKTLIWYNNNIWWYMMYVFHLSLRSLLQYLSILSSNMHATHRGLLHECRKIWGNSVKPQTGRLKLVRVSLISQQKYGNHHLLVSCFLTCFQICWDILLLFVSWRLEGLKAWLCGCGSSHAAPPDTSVQPSEAITMVKLSISINTSY